MHLCMAIASSTGMWNSFHAGLNQWFLGVSNWIYFIDFHCQDVIIAFFSYRCKCSSIVGIYKKGGIWIYFLEWVSLIALINCRTGRVDSYWKGHLQWSVLVFHIILQVPRKFNKSWQRLESSKGTIVFRIMRLSSSEISNWVFFRVFCNAPLDYFEWLLGVKSFLQMQCRYRIGVGILSFTPLRIRPVKRKHMFVMEYETVIGMRWGLADLFRTRKQLQRLGTPLLAYGAWRVRVVKKFLRKQKLSQKALCWNHSVKEEVLWLLPCTRGILPSFVLGLLGLV